MPEVLQEDQIWYDDWQSSDHARLFDGRCVLSSRGLVRNYESFNDVRLLNEWLDSTRELTLLEVGCATGEFHRYLKVKHPFIHYAGVDISRAAIARAKEKYPLGRFFVCEPEEALGSLLQRLNLPRNPQVVYTKDVVHHQTRPLEFISQLLQVTGEALVIRTRTRDVGETIMDPQLSCQYHYQGWMPYLVLNVQELIDHIRGQAPGCELVIYKNPTVLGGRENRFLPKDCYLPQTGTAETAVGVFLKTSYPGRVRIEERKDMEVGLAWRGRCLNLARRLLKRGSKERS